MRRLVEMEKESEREREWKSRCGSRKTLKNCMQNVHCTCNISGWERDTYSHFLLFHAYISVSALLVHHTQTPATHFGKQKRAPKCVCVCVCTSSKFAMTFGVSKPHSPHRLPCVTFVRQIRSMNLCWNAVSMHIKQHYQLNVNPESLFFGAISCVHNQIERYCVYECIYVFVCVSTNIAEWLANGGDCKAKTFFALFSSFFSIQLFEEWITKHTWFTFQMDLEWTKYRTLLNALMEFSFSLFPPSKWWVRVRVRGRVWLCSYVFVCVCVCVKMYTFSPES